MEAFAAPCRQEEEGEDGSKLQEKEEAAKKSESERDWMALPQGPLSLISEQLQSEIDVVRFRSVCTSWRSAAPRRQSPFVLTRDALVALSGARIPDIPDFRLNRPYCSSCGWVGVLLTPGQRFNTSGQPIILFNPITADHIHLPIVTGLDSTDYRMRLILSSNPATTSAYTGAILCYQKLAIYRSGDKAWSVTPFPQSRRILYRSDVAFHRGLIYVADTNQIFVFDPEADSKLVGSIPVPCVDGETSCGRDLDCCRCLDLSSLLVESCGDLLLVRNNFVRNNFDSIDDDRRAEVFKLHFWDGKLLRRMMKIENSLDLSDRALFLGQGCSFSLSATKLPQYKGNHIYFMDGPYLYAYGLADGKVERASPALNCWSEAPWFRPHLM